MTESPAPLADKKYITVLNVFSSLAVVLLHSSGFWTFSYRPCWLAANIIETLFYFAVPVFFMLSGVTLLDYPERYGTGEYFKKRIRKTVIPYLAWSLIGLVYQNYYGRLDVSDFSVRWLLYFLVNSGIISVYWFFIPLFAQYCAVPIFAAVDRERRKTVYVCAIICMFLFNSLLPLLFVLLKMNYNLQLTVLSGYTIYLFIGYCIDNYPIKRLWRYVIYIFALIGFFMHILGTKALTYRAGEIVETYKGYLNVPSILQSTGVFVLFRYIDGTKVMDVLYRLSKPFRKATMGVYLIHIYLLWQLRLRLPEITADSFLYRIPTGIAVFMFSALITRVIQRLPGGKIILPE